VTVNAKQEQTLLIPVLKFACYDAFAFPGLLPHTIKHVLRDLQILINPIDSDGVITRITWASAICLPSPRTSLAPQVASSISAASRFNFSP
jgi:hypothetical protein